MKCPHEKEKMIVDVLVSYTIRHRYAKTSNLHVIPLTIISSATGLTIEVSHQSYSRFIPSSTASTCTHTNAWME